eukprot:3338693-Pleurochrysis_carterae.AAC.1
MICAPAVAREVYIVPFVEQIDDLAQRVLPRAAPSWRRPRVVTHAQPARDLGVEVAGNAGAGVC